MNSSKEEDKEKEKEAENAVYITSEPLFPILRYFTLDQCPGLQRTVF